MDFRFDSPLASSSFAAVVCNLATATVASPSPSQPSKSGLPLALCNKMSASTSERSPVRGSAKGKCTSGWAAFDLKHKQKSQLIEPNKVSEGYPLLSGPTFPNTLSNKHGVLLEKPFSSVVATPLNFPSLVDTTDGNKKGRAPVGNDCLLSAHNIETDNESVEVYQKLKCLHSWADESLIRDVLAGVSGDVDSALSLLGDMLISENKAAESKKVDPSKNAIVSFGVDDGFVGENKDASFTTDGSFSNEFKDDLTSAQLLGAIKSLPIEPEAEWQEDDVYLIHRKDAISMTRLASRHSKAANDAYLRGDHKAAIQLSLKAREEWTAAQKLHSKAAKEILNVRNCENDLWKLDLHGLHAAEAVEALRERLQVVESLFSPNCLATLDAVQKESCVSLAASMSSADVKMEKFGRRLLPSRQRQNLLQVITGKGNHSRGAAALPSAIRNYLGENRYHFDETRSGMIMIRPKFRRQ
ncbi:smr (Small MutS Related) domain-containing protein [Striga hermonthica]|uniref:Smr (Small MutS Related) domain-containing protein n=1 Tax=Striga hermonthica TaxID=68872 RepID=A0A9N7NY90_STRHE|nr:smr (Small MutS Related) domain-containing protein [Striga hermonthica]